MKPTPLKSQPPTLSLFTKIVVGVVGGIILLIVSAAIIHNLGTHGSAFAPSEQAPSYVQKEMDKISVQIAVDAEKQYEIAKRSGTASDAYVNAGLVAAAYLQAKDEPNYIKWKGIEAQEASRAGISAP